MKKTGSLVRPFVVLLLFLAAYVTAPGQASDTVCITRTGAKYHKETCHYLKYSSYKVSLKEATTRGYTACSVCKPGTLRTHSGATAPAATPQRLNSGSGQSATTRQCSATTQAGTRCKRTTTSSNGKCWQHQ